jgi:hypothetical protein
MTYVWPVLLGFAIGLVLIVLAATLHRANSRAYLAEHHCEKRSMQTTLDSLGEPTKQTIYVCDGGEVVIQ